MGGVGFGFGDAVICGRGPVNGFGLKEVGNLALRIKGGRLWRRGSRKMVDSSRESQSVSRRGGGWARVAGATSRRNWGILNYSEISLPVQTTPLHTYPNIRGLGNGCRDPDVGAENRVSNSSESITARKTNTMDPVWSIQFVSNENCG